MADEVKKAKLEFVIEEELDEEEAVAIATPKRGRSSAPACGSAAAAMSNLPNFDPIKVGGDVVLAQHAEVIRALGKRVVHDVIEIGRRLTDAKARCGHWQLAAVAGARVRMER
jgi:hypothetical protein